MRDLFIISPCKWITSVIKISIVFFILIRSLIHFFLFTALKEQGGEFFLNGNWAVNSSGTYPAAGTIFYYQSPQRYTGDSLTSLGPLLNSVDVMVSLF